MTFNSLWYGFAALVITDAAVVYFISYRYMKDEKCLLIARVVMAEYLLSALCGVCLYYIPFASPLRWAPFIALCLHLFDNTLISASFVIRMRSLLKADGDKTLVLRCLFYTVDITYREGGYASYKKQYFLAVFLKLTVIFSSLLTLCFAFSSFVFFKTL